MRVDKAAKHVKHNDGKHNCDVYAQLEVDGRQQVSHVRQKVQLHHDLHTDCQRLTHELLDVELLSVCLATLSSLNRRYLFWLADLSVLDHVLATRVRTFGVFLSISPPEFEEFVQGSFEVVHYYK